MNVARRQDEQGDLFGSAPTSAPPPAPEPTKRLSGMITIKDIAKRHGVGRTTARRWLLALDAQSGGKVILRAGTRLYTTVAKLHAVDSGWVEAREIEVDEIAELKKKNALLEKELRLVKSRIKDVIIAFRPEEKSVRGDPSET